MDNLNTISYEEGWKTASAPVKYESAAEKETKPRKKKNAKAALPLVFVIQVIVSIIAVLSFFVIKQIGGEFYNSTKEAYNREVNNEIILKGAFESFTLETVSDAAEN